MKQVWRGWKWRWAATIWFIIIIITLLTPPPPIEKGAALFDGADKLAHFALFGIWTVLLVLSSIQQYCKIKYSSIAIIIVIMSVLTEFIQLCIPGRSAEILDGCTDIAGGFLVLLAIFIWRKF